mmetsp:Transcript_6329/g.19614  ORF Transcript_6329/g.19614 Transcript_6329/m.19614 type:complete len:280 (+) Transcript_6329:822-1661(+)
MLWLHLPALAQILQDGRRRRRARPEVSRAPPVTYGQPDDGLQLRHADRGWRRRACAAAHISDLWRCCPHRGGWPYGGADRERAPHRAHDDWRGAGAGRGQGGQHARREAHAGGRRQAAALGQREEGCTGRPVSPRGWGAAATPAAAASGMWCLQKRRGGGVGRLLSALGTACAKDGAGTDLAAGQRCAPKGVEHSTAPMQRPEPDQGGGLSRPSSDDQELCARSCLLSGVCVGREGASCHLVTPRAGRQLSGARDGALAGLVLARGGLGRTELGGAMLL